MFRTATVDKPDAASLNNGIFFFNKKVFILIVTANKKRKDGQKRALKKRRLFSRIQLLPIKGPAHVQKSHIHHNFIVDKTFNAKTNKKQRCVISFQTLSSDLFAAGEIAPEKRTKTNTGCKCSISGKRKKKKVCVVERTKSPSCFRRSILYRFLICVVFKIHVC